VRLYSMLVKLFFLFVFSFSFWLSRVSTEVRVNHIPLFMAYYHNWSVQISHFIYRSIMFSYDWLLACDILRLPLIIDMPCNKKPHFSFLEIICIKTPEGIIGQHS